MPILSIPDDHKFILRAIGSMDDNNFKAIVSAMEDGVPLSANAPKLRQELVGALPPALKGTANGVVAVTLALHQLQVSNDRLTADKIIDGINDSLEQFPATHDWIGDEANKGILNARLLALLDLQGLRRWAKAFEVLLDNERNFRAARVISNVRPIFGESPDETPIGWILVHTLKLSFRENGRRNHFFMTLDDSDLAKLIKQLDRARIKANTLKQSFVNPDISRYESESEE